MSKEIRPYKKNGRAAARIQSETQGLVSAIRVETDEDTPDNFLELIDNAKYFTCKNVGNKDIYLRFNSDDENNYWTLLPNEKLPVAIMINDLTSIKAYSKGGKSMLECLVWG